MMCDMATLSRHAQRRRKEMKITEHQIDAVLQEPETVYPGSMSRQHPEGRTCYQRGAIVVVVEDATGDVVTVLWHRKEGR